MLDIKDKKKMGVITPPMSVKAQKVRLNWATQRWLFSVFYPLHTMFDVVCLLLILWHQFGFLQIMHKDIRLFWKNLDVLLCDKAYHIMVLA